ncbi:head GIN domain-containing protein [Microbacterium terregens]|jgi:Putative auto-transporter adhesin, head GIN domain|uniref:Head GIN domain-containing protein n=1 Tax=Microbacterium terregens TaxID=69363 RepID=A0ABV5T353_9MICO
MRTTRSAAALVSAALAATASVLALAGCVPTIVAGPMSSEEREIDAVTIVVLDTAGDLSISEGAPGLVIHAPEGALARLTSEVDGETLVLGTTPGPEIVVGDVRYELTLPELAAIDLNGSGDVDATVSGSGPIRLDLDGSGDVEWTGLETERVEVVLAGSGEIEISGSATELSIQLEGSGNVDASDLQAQTADVSIAGSGDIDVSVRDDLVAGISGSGRVTYSGDPSVESDVTGSGDVVRE